MSGILRLESLTKGNTLKQGDKTPLKYRLFDADGEKLNIAGKSAKVRLVYPDFLTIGYEKDGLTVTQDDTVTFTIDNVIPSRIYHVEIIVDDKFIFPSRADESKFTVDKSSLGTESNIIEIVGVDAVVRKAVDLINDDPNLIIDEDKLVNDIISNTGIGSIEEYHQQFNDVIKELSEEKDYHSLPEIAGARGGHDTLGQRLDETTAQLAQTATKEELNLQIGKLKSATPEFASNVSEMTDTNKVYVNLSDGYLYLYDGDWINTGVKYQSSGVGARSIDFDELVENVAENQLNVFEILNRLAPSNFSIENLSAIKTLNLYGFDKNKRYSIRSMARNNTAGKYRIIIVERQSDGTWLSYFDTGLIEVDENPIGVTEITHTIGRKKMVMSIDYDAFIQDGGIITESDIDTNGVKFVIKNDCIIEDNPLEIVSEIKNGGFKDGVNGWIGQKATVTSIDETLKVNVTGSSGSARNNIYLEPNTTYYASIDLLNPVKNCRISIYDTTTLLASKFSKNIIDDKVYFIFKTPETLTNTQYFRIMDLNSPLGQDIYVDNVILINLTAIYGADHEPSVDDFNKNINGLEKQLADGERKLYVTDLNKDQVSNNVTNPLSRNEIVATKQDNSFKVKFNYSDTENMIIEFNELGPNAIIHPVYFYKEPNGNDGMSFDDSTLTYTLKTDWIAPYYGLTATDDAGTGNNGAVGGNHGLGDNNVATAYTEKAELYVDGNLITDGDIKTGDKATLVVTNIISAANRVDLTTGEKTASMEEVVTYNITSNNIEVSVYLTALENISISGYGGFQMTTNMFSGKAYFNDSNQAFAIDFETHGSESLPFNDDRVVYGNENQLIAMYTNRDIGLGKLTHISDKSVHFLSSNGKLYSHLIKEELTMPKDDSQMFSGGYTFMKPFECLGAEQAYFIKHNGEKIYCVDFKQPIASTYLRLPENSGVEIDILEKTETISNDSFVSGKGLKLESSGVGTLKFKVKNL